MRSFALFLLAAVLLTTANALSAEKSARAFDTTALQKNLGKGWTVEKTSDGYLITSTEKIAFLPLMSASTKKDLHQQVSAARRDYVRIKVLFGHPLTDREVANLRVNDYVLPELQRQQQMGFFPGDDDTRCTDPDYLTSHRKAPIYILTNSAPTENTYPSDATQKYNLGVYATTRWCGVPERLIIED